ncbi:MAG TPA: succinylglutamate desuccinylase/aspartoacylase family protein [Saprospiraceae bacterium]|nr:succinylglutamate desuccinylase/aspartoacylase family protein [Saprospiraceae bacterium]
MNNHIFQGMDLTDVRVTSRILGTIRGKNKGPLYFFFAGIHGNEKAGIIALQELFQELETHKESIKGTLHAILGNRSAFFENTRFIDIDLNRIWTEDRIAYVKDSNRNALNIEELEMLDLIYLINHEIQDKKTPVYFIDFHTTSSKSIPFITINDALINRKLAMKFPVPVILGIEEFLEGPMLSYINSKGFVALGFEAGQHNDPKSIENTLSFIYLTLSFTGAFIQHDPKKHFYHFNRLAVRSSHLNKAFEIVHHHPLGSNDSFQMLPGFESFQTIKKGETLAMLNGHQFHSPISGRILMPLYQKLGNDAFFIIHRIPEWALKLSSFLRKYKLYSLLRILPGIQKDENNKKVLIADLNITKYLAKSIFHLFGYRIQKSDDQNVRLYNRERTSKKNIYRKTPWW